MQLLEVDRGEVFARVSGTSDYSVSLEISRDGLVEDFSCSCPYVSDDRACKHVWAVAVELDELSRRTGAGGYVVLGVEDAARRSSHAFTDEVDDDEFDDDEFDDEFDDDEFDDDELADDDHDEHWSGRPTQSWSRYRHSEQERLRWQRLLGAVDHPATRHLGNPAAQTWYLIDLYRGGRGGHYWRDSSITLHAARRTLRKNGELAKPTAVGKSPEGVRPPGVEGVVWAIARTGSGGTAALGGELALEALRDLSEKGRLGAVEGIHSKDVIALRWDAEQRFRAVLRATATPSGESFQVGVVLRRPRATETAPSSDSRPAELALAESESGEAGPGDPEPNYEELPLSAIDATLDFDLLVSGGRLIRLLPNHVQWVDGLFREPLLLDHEGLQELTNALSRTAGAPPIEGDGVPEAELSEHPLRPLLRLRLPAKAAKLVRGTLSFRYGLIEVGYQLKNSQQGGAVVLRDLAAETAVVTHLQQLGVTVELSPATHHVRSFELKFDVEDFSAIAPSVLDAGFLVELEGKPYRRPGRFSPIIESGQDWFELEATVEFEGELVQLPELLRAIRKREQWIRLRDGSLGMIPSAWIDSLSDLAEFVAPRAKTLRFHPIAAGFVEGVLSGAADLQTDAGFTAMKQALSRFEAITPLAKPRGFVGELRDYQALALGWLHALDELGFGGCLADDMGLGKTVVVLAWLLQRQKTTRGGKAPRSGVPRTSLLVVPKSLLFNWQRECERFTPKLRLLLHHGQERQAPGEHFAQYDIVLTSYGTLRRDAEMLARHEFDYVVLDEAHGIKNASTESHKAARGLSSRRRLALTGTPVENHLGELWNLLTYLNPSVMQNMAHLQKIFEGRRLTRGSIEAGVLRFIQPFILRRTKADVAKELPERIEKTLEVQLSSSERKLYDELALYYRRRMAENRAINKRYKQLGSGAAGNGQSGRQMADALEGLLRLRQAACHPGLLDEKRTAQSSSKFEVLLEQLHALRAEGHKALVFSQFTRLLELLKPHLETAGIGYAYLDGKTRDRASVVDTFSNDPDKHVFLISLKAGGVGLNLVAADYVFLLDPWWNPASEAQAIDRAHRIGQTRTVIAYRLLSANTVEGKVAELQDEKRELALSLFGDEESFSAKFTREDLERLLE